MTSKPPSIEDMETLPFDVTYIPEFAVKKCEIELNETPGQKMEALLEIRILLKENQTTSGIDFQNDFLVQYLRRNKYRMKKTVQHLESFVNLNRKHGYLFQNIPDEYYSSKPSTEFMTILPKRCPDGCTLILFRLGKWDPDDLPFENVQQMMTMMFSQALRNPMSQINGFKLINDFSGTKFNHLKHCTPYNLNLLYHCAMNCFSMRYKGLHFINMTFMFKVMWTFIGPLLTQKLKNRVFIHSNVEELLDHFPHSVLPTEYGGTLEDITTKDWVRKANKEQAQHTVEGWTNFY